jgi:heavy metal sensor kinase
VTSRINLVTLTTRLNLFFAATLAVVLAGFSVSLYILARHHLHEQTDTRLEAALHTLVAAVEVGPDGVEWEPDQRRLILAEDLAWRIEDEQGRLIDSGGPAGVDWGDANWRSRDGRVIAPLDGAIARPAAGKFRTFSIKVGTSLEPVRTELRRLAGALTGLSLAVWLVAVVAGRVVSRRALRPVRDMTAATRSIGAADLGERLPVPGARDELDDLSKSFNDLLGRVQEAFERQRRFTGDASHQLRTPLTAILGQAEVALRRDRPPEEYRDALARIHGRAEHLLRVVESLLFLARADADAAPGALEVHDLPAWLNDHLAHWAEHPRWPDLRVEVPACDVGVRAQPALLGQLVDNLLDNAFKYSSAGSPVTLRVARDDASIFLSVEDRGTGIAVEDLLHVFEPFYRSAEAQRRGRPGVGLGLAIARRIAIAFGGELTAKSEPGQWTRLTLRLSAA